MSCCTGLGTFDSILPSKEKICGTLFGWDGITSLPGYEKFKQFSCDLLKDHTFRTYREYKEVFCRKAPQAVLETATRIHRLSYDHYRRPLIYYTAIGTVVFFGATCILDRLGYKKAAEKVGISLTMCSAVCCIFAATFGMDRDCQFDG